MKKTIIIVCTVLCLTASAWSQGNITVQDAIGQSPAVFLQNHLLGGGVYIFNAKFNNATSIIGTANIGTFQSNGFPGLMMANGVLMTTGNISVAPGPNNTTGLSTPIEGYYSDPEMAAVATSSINGCSTLDFDFVSLSNTVSFNYTFASEEYPEYVCSQYNDVFAFYVTGPDPVTGEEVTRNIAIIPGTVSSSTPDGIAVAINSVNPGVPGASAGTGASGCYYDYSGFYVDNNFGNEYGGPTVNEGIQYDGYTSKLTAETTVMPCQVYHMHISVCNVGDNAFDSGVFLEGGRFTAPTAAIGLSRTGTDTVRGSCPFEIPLTLSQTSFDEGRVHFSFGGTAEEGVDFVLLDGAGMAVDSLGLFIDNGVHSFVLRGQPGADLQQDKTIEVYLATSLCSDFPQLLTYDTMHFVLTQGGDVRVKDTTIRCSYACFEVGTELIYGEEPVSYRWEPTTGIDAPYSLHSTAMIFETSDYLLIATGGSGCNSDTAEVHIVITGEEPPVGIDEVAGEGVRVYPNPAGDVIHIDGTDVQRVEVFTIEGRKVYEQNFHAVSGTVDIPTDDLPAGVYGIRVGTVHGMSGAKIVVNK